MKKFLMFICTLILTLGLFGCGANVASAEDYTIDKEIEVKEELTLEQAQAKFEELEDESGDAKYLTCTFTMNMGGVAMDMTMILINDKNGINGSMISTTKYGGVNTSVEMYIKDNYILMDMGAIGGKVKVEIPSDEDIDTDDLSGFDLTELITEFFEEADKQSENFKAGFDAAGCLVLDYAENDMKARFVFDKNYPVYFYAQEGVGNTMEFKFSYEKTKVEFPEDLNPEDYKTIAWDQFQGGSIM